MTGIAQNGQKRLIFIVAPQVKTKMREKDKKTEWISQRKTQGYTDTYTCRLHTYADTHLFVIQVR